MSGSARSSSSSVTAGGTIASLWRGLATTAGSASALLASAAPWGSWAVDVGWAVASSALLLALPIVIEVQREATVRIMQHQRELETTQLQEQARAQAGGLLQQAQALGTLIAGPPKPAD